MPNYRVKLTGYRNMSYSHVELIKANNIDEVFDKAHELNVKDSDWVFEKDESDSEIKLDEVEVEEIKNG